MRFINIKRWSVREIEREREDEKERVRNRYSKKERCWGKDWEREITRERKGNIENMIEGEKEVEQR